MFKENDKSETWVSRSQVNYKRLDAFSTIVWEVADNIAQEKIICNVVLMLLGQPCIG